MLELHQEIEQIRTKVQYIETCLKGVEDWMQLVDKGLEALKQKLAYSEVDQESSEDQSLEIARSWPDGIEGGGRCGIEQVEGLKNWWVGYSPRNGRGASVEGAWADWVVLAHRILDREAALRKDDDS